MKYKYLDSIKLCYASPSLGMHSSHTLQKKIQAISEAGYPALEIGMPDLMAVANVRDDSQKSFYALHTAAEKVGKWCRNAGLQVLVLQPHSNFEGYTDQKVKEVKMHRAERWLRLCGPLRCGMLQVGSNDDRSTTSDHEEIANDLRNLCEMAEGYGVKVAYEPWCWGAHINTWKGCYEIMKLVNKPNFGLNLDTFQIAGKEWADPGHPSGVLQDSERDGKFRESMDELARTVKGEDIFFLQISDGYKVHLTKDDEEWDEGVPEARALWSHSYRPLPLDESRKGYLPVTEVTEAVLKTGFRGWFSYEVFLKEMKDESFDMASFAKSGMESHKKLMEACQKG